MNDLRDQIRFLRFYPPFFDTRGNIACTESIRWFDDSHECQRGGCLFIFVLFLSARMIEKYTYLHETDNSVSWQVRSAGQKTGFA